MQREDRYIVLKKKDIVDALDKVQFEQLKNICRIIYRYRDDVGKKDLECVVVENDWPEYETVWRMIESRVDGIEPEF